MVEKESKKDKKHDLKNYPTLDLKDEHEIALDFAVKAYKKFDKLIKSAILFGSSTKGEATSSSDIDIILVVDDVSIKFDQDVILWYRKELSDLLKVNPYKKHLHINTIKLSTWWQDLMRGDPVLLNVLRYGEALVDLGGFFEPIKFLLINGQIRPSPEAIYNCLERAPKHIARSVLAELGAIEGLYWSMVDSAHAALIAAGKLPPSPEQIPKELNEIFVDKGILKSKYVIWYRELHKLHKDITHGRIKELKGIEIDDWQEKAKQFLDVMVGLVKVSIN